MRVGVTGHMSLSQDTVLAVRKALLEYLSRPELEPLIGVSCLARGADSIFAEVVLELGGSLKAVLPSPNYREKVEHDHIGVFDRLLGQASEVRAMPFRTASRDAYAAANNYLLGSVDQLVAVWDGAPSRHRGGTAEAVAGARSRGLEVHVIWPVGASRSQA